MAYNLTEAEINDLKIAAQTLLSIDDWGAHVSNFLEDSLLEEQAEDMEINLRCAINKLAKQKESQ